MSDAWFIEATGLLSQQYPASRTTESARSLIKRKKVKVIYSEIFFLDQECINARKEYEFIKRDHKYTVKELVACVEKVKKLEAYKRRSLVHQKRLDRYIKKLAELRKKNLHENKVLREWRKNSPINRVSKS